jgi:hypothetical protein
LGRKDAGQKNDDRQADRGLRAAQIDHLGKAARQMAPHREPAQVHDHDDDQRCYKLKPRCHEFRLRHVPRVNQSKSAAMSSWEFVARIPERKRPRCFQRGLFNFLGVDLTRRGFLVCPR